MKWQRSFAILTTAAVLAAPAQAGLIFGKKKAPVDPNQRVPELLDVVRTSPDEHKRAQAAEELRRYDPQAYPDMVPVLIGVLAGDAKPSVRAEAASTLGKLRPISPAVGQALEQALAKDGSMRVRLQVRSSLLQYHWSGYRTPKKDAVPPQTKEPPLAPPLPGERGPATPPVTLAPPVTHPPPAAGPPAPAAPAPAVPPVVVTPPGDAKDPSVPVIKMTPVPSGARPMPTGPAQPAPPAAKPKPAPPSPSGAAEQGPELSPPKW